MATTWLEIANAAESTVATNRVAGATSLVVASGTVFGAAFPMALSIVRDGSLLCVLKATARSGGTFTIDGTLDGSTDVNMIVGDRVLCAPVAAYLTQIQDAADALEAGLAGKAATSHTHAIADTTGLQTALDARATAADLASHTGSTANPHSVTAAQVGSYTTAQADTLLAGKANTSHSHAIADVTGLQTALDAKAAASALSAHTSSTANPHAVTAAQVGAYTTTATDTLLSGKAATSHSHAASDLASGTVATARLGSGAASSSTYLRGDQTWATPTASVPDPLTLTTSLTAPTVQGSTASGGSLAIQGSGHATKGGVTINGGFAVDPSGVAQAPLYTFNLQCRIARSADRVIRVVDNAGNKGGLDGMLYPIAQADSAAPSNTVYFSTDSNKLVYKDSGGTVNPLY